MDFWQNNREQQSRTAVTVWEGVGSKKISIRSGSTCTASAKPNWTRASVNSLKGTQTPWPEESALLRHL